MSTQMVSLKARATRIWLKFDKLKQSATDMVNLGIDIGTELVLAKGELAHGQWGEWAEENLPFNRNQAHKYLRLATHGAQARALNADAEAPLTINEVCELLPGVKDAPVVTSADPDQMAYAGLSNGKKSRDADDWQTPGEYIEDAREVMGGIDLDPFSSSFANEIVKAKHFFTLADDAHETPWAGPDIRTVWMNPPYGRGVMADAVDRFIEQYMDDAFAEGIVLTNNSTESYWFHKLMVVSSMMCVKRGRVSFLTKDGKTAPGNTRGQVFFYVGRNPSKFEKVFKKHRGCVPLGGYNDE